MKTREELLIAHRVVSYLREHHIEPGPSGEIEVCHVYTDRACTVEPEVDGLYDKIFVHIPNNKLTALIQLFPGCATYYVDVYSYDWEDDDGWHGFYHGDDRPWSEVLEYPCENEEPDAIPQTFPVKLTVSADVKTMYCYYADGTKASTAYVPNFDAAYILDLDTLRSPEVGSSPDELSFIGWCSGDISTSSASPWEIEGEQGTAREYDGKYAGWVSDEDRLIKFNEGSTTDVPVIDEYFPTYVGIFWDNQAEDGYGVYTAGGHTVVYGDIPVTPAQILGMNMNTGHWITITGDVDNPASFKSGDEVQTIQYCAQPIKYSDGVYVRSTGAFHIINLEDSELSIKDVSIDESKGLLVRVASRVFKGVYTGVLQTDDSRFLYYIQGSSGAASYYPIKNKVDSESSVFCGQLANDDFVVFNDGTVWKKYMNSSYFEELSTSIPDAVAGIQYSSVNAYVVTRSGDVYDLSASGPVKLTNKFPAILLESCQFVNDCLYVAGGDGIYKMTKSNVISKVCSYTGMFSVDSNGRVFVKDSSTYKFYMVASGSDPVEIDFNINHEFFMF